MNNFMLYGRSVDPFFHLRDYPQVVKIAMSIKTPEDLEARKTVSRFDTSKSSWVIEVDCEEVTGPKLWTISRLMLITLINSGAFEIPRRKFYVVRSQEKKLSVMPAEE